MSREPLPALPCAAFYAAYFGVLGVVLPFLGPYLDFKGIGAMGVGLVTAAFSLSKVAYAPLLGVVIDRGWWMRGVLSLHVALSLAGAVLLRWADTTASCIAASFVAGVGFGAVLPLVEAAILDHLPRVGYGALRLWGSVGFVVASVVTAAVLAPQTGGFPLLLAAALALLLLTCLPFENAARPHHTAASRRIPGAVWALLVLLTLHQAAHGPYYAFFSIHLQENGLSSTAIAAAWSLAVVAELVAFLAGRWMEGTIGMHRLLFMALLLSPARWILLALPVSTPVLVVAQIGHAVTFALVHLTGIQIVQGAVPRASRRFAQALYSGLSFGLGIVLGTALAGPLYAAVGGSGSFLVAAGLSAALALLWLPIGRVLHAPA
jgi:PPP family 3-phenylpropionic acid transporter